LAAAWWRVSVEAAIALDQGLAVLSY